VEDAAALGSRYGVVLRGRDAHPHLRQTFNLALGMRPADGDGTRI